MRQQRDQLESAHRSVQELVTSSWERLLAATAAIDAFKAEVRANQIALEGVQQEALVGARTVLDVLDAEQELFTSQVNLVRASREEILASYQLKLAVGQLTVDGPGAAGRAVRRGGLLRAQPHPAVRRRRLVSHRRGLTNARRAPGCCGSWLLIESAR